MQHHAGQPITGQLQKKKEDTTMKTIEALAQEVRNADAEHKPFSRRLCRELAEAIGEAERFDSLKVEADDSIDAIEYKQHRRYEIAEEACFKLHIARYGSAMVWIDGCDPYWDWMDEILDNENGLWARIAAAIHADPALKDEKAIIRAIEDFRTTSLFCVYVEV